MWGGQWGGQGPRRPGFSPVVRRQPLEVVTNMTPCPHRYLSYTLNPDLIRKQDATSTIISIANNVVGQTLAWDFIQSNWRKLFLE